MPDHPLRVAPAHLRGPTEEIEAIQAGEHDRCLELPDLVTEQQRRQGVQPTGILDIAHMGVEQVVTVVADADADQILFLTDPGARRAQVGPVSRQHPVLRGRCQEGHDGLAAFFQLPVQLHDLDGRPVAGEHHGHHHRGQQCQGQKSVFDAPVRHHGDSLTRMRRERATCGLMVTV